MSLRAQGFSGQVQFAGVANHAVENRIGQRRIADQIVPFVDRELACCQRGPVSQLHALPLRSGLTFALVICLLICTMTLSGCATVAPETSESMQRSALDGDAQAQYEMGMKYFDARYDFWRGRAAYWEDAARWFEMAARQGDARAQYRLSQYYFNVRQDYGQSFELTQLAAQQGVAEAQYSLGMHFGQAWGTEQDLVPAYKWIALANDGGVVGGSLADTEWLVWKGELTRQSDRRRATTRRRA